MTSETLLDLDLRVDYPNKRDVLRDVSLHLQEGEILGLVGESGSGKSTLALAIMGLLNHKGGQVKGRISFRGRELTQLRERELRDLRGREISLVLQSPMASLNPMLRVEAQLKEAWRAHCGDQEAWRRRLPELMRSVRLPSDRSFLRRFPPQLSVGQAQRLLIAMAVMHSPSLVIADEPTSALDVITQSEIIELFKSLNRWTGASILFISHDLLSVAALCHRIAILKDGQVVECAPCAEIFRHPNHPYTRRLVEAMPRSPLETTEPLAKAARAAGQR